jgi:pimeloyl-[acyl-carrier protein] synthase
MTTFDDEPSLVELFDPAWAADPYPYYRHLRERHPVYWDAPLRSWVVTRFEDIVGLSRDGALSEDRITPFHRRLSPARQTAMEPLAAVLRDMMLFNDAPRHTALRAMARSGFSRRATERLRATIEATVAGLLDAVGPAGQLDVVADVAQPLTRTVIADLLGLAEEDRWLLDDWSSLLHEYFTQSDAQNERIARLREVFDRMAARPACPHHDDLVRHMVAGAGTADEMFANFLLVIDAGQVTTTYLVPNAVRALLQFPDQLRLLAQRPELLPGAAHELMRYDSSVQFTSRIAVADLDVGGHLVRAGQPVTLVLGSGNRDPERFAEPDRLDVTRDAHAQLSFGHGRHYCLGAPLGLAEIEIVIGAMLGRLPDLRLGAAPLRWHESINFRFLQALPVSFG